MLQAVGYRFALLTILSSAFTLVFLHKVPAAPLLIALAMVILSAHTHRLLSVHHPPTSLAQLICIKMTVSVWSASSALALALSPLAALGRERFFDAWVIWAIFGLVALIAVGFAFVGGKRGDVVATATVFWWLLVNWIGMLVFPAGDRTRIAATVAFVVGSLAYAKSAYFTWFAAGGGIRLAGTEGEREPLLPAAQARIGTTPDEAAQQVALGRPLHTLSNATSTNPNLFSFSL